MRGIRRRVALTVPGTRARMAAGPPSPESAGMGVFPCPAATATADVP
jgi:hypothetical protein